MAMPIPLRRFTVDEYHRMGETGILTEDDRVELVDGEIVQMSPIGPPHAGCVKRLTRIFAPFAADVVLSVQDPTVLDTYSEPQPDFALLRDRADGYSRAHPAPEDILLLVEVADTSLAYDRTVKMPLYARAGIEDAWIVNLSDDCIEVYREPRNGVYVSRQIVGRDETLSPLALPGVVLQSNEILHST